MDREALDPFALLDEIEKTLALDVTPITWPIGMGKTFRGSFDIINDRLYIFDSNSGESISETIECNGIYDKKLADIIPPAQLAQFQEEVEMVRAGCKPFDREAYLEGHLTPVFFGSAVNNFGVRELLNAICNFAPCPRPQNTDSRLISPEENNFSGFVFKVQANMDKNHRDRIAFVRICSGKYSRGMKVLHVRTGKNLSLNNPVLFLARERELAEEAFPGDIIGIPNHGGLAIGDALTEGEKLHFTGVPSFAPELFKRARLDDPLRSKQLKKALEELSQEGASQIFKPLNGSNWIIGVVGALQFEVIASRLESEYNVKGSFEEINYTTARWIKCENADDIKKFTDKNFHNIAEDATGALAYLAPNEWHLTRLKDENKGIDFAKTRENR